MMAAAALVILAGSAIVAILATVRTGKLLSGLPMVADLWLAASLLQLAASDSWIAIAGTAALLAISTLVSTALLES